MPLAALYGQRAGQRAAAAVFNGLAQSRRVGRLTHQTEIRDIVCLPHPVDHLHRAVDRVSFFIACYNQAEAAGQLIRGKIASDRRHKGRDAAFHICRAPAINQAVFYLTRERPI